MLKYAVVAAFVALLKAAAEAWLPGFPITVELLNSVVLALLAVFGVEVIEFAARKKIEQMRNRGLWK